MNNLNNLNLDVTKYSNLELKEILGLIDTTNDDITQLHISKIETTLLKDKNLSFNNKK